MAVNKPVIVCVDEELSLLDKLKAEISLHFSTEYEVILAESGSGAIEIFSDLLSEDVEIPIVLSDYSICDMKGDELLIKLHKISPTTTKVLLTGEATIAGISNAVNHANLYRYITKPWNNSDLILTIEEGIKSYYKDKRLQEQNLQLHNMNLALEKKVREVQEKSEDIRASINYAKRIQNALLPRPETIAAALPKHFIYYRPKDVVSGDFYWFYQTILGNTFIAGIDCTGHGVPGAFMSVIANNLLNKIVIDMEIYYPNEILNELTKAVKWVLKQGDNSNNRDGMDVSMCKITADRKKVLYSGAVHSLCYFQDDTFNEIKATKCSIGDSLLDLPPEGYALHEVKITQPTNFYIFSDGYRDQIGADNKIRFMSKRFRELLAELQQETEMEAQKKMVDKALDDWTNHWEVKQTDDILVIGFRIE